MRIGKAAPRINKDINFESKNSISFKSTSYPYNAKTENPRKRDKKIVRPLDTYSVYLKPKLSSCKF